MPTADVLGMARICIGGAAAEHLFSVACGLDSMAVGEDQIVAQIKAAARAAAAAGTTGPAVTSLIDAALRASKRARTQTTISTEGISLARAGLDLAHAHVGGLAGRDAVVLGTGPTGRLAARLLREAGAGRLSVASRDATRAAEVAAAVHGTPLRTSDVPAALAGAEHPGHGHRGHRARAVRRAGSGRPRRRRPGGRCSYWTSGCHPTWTPPSGAWPALRLIDLTALGQHLPTRAAPDQIAQVRDIVAARGRRLHRSGRNKRRPRPSSPRCTRRSDSSLTPN